METTQINDLLTGQGDAVEVQEILSVIDLQTMEWQTLSSSGTSQPELELESGTSQTDEPDDQARKKY